MRKELPESEIPQWLLEIEKDPTKANGLQMPLEDILNDSLFHPGCGLRGFPVKHFAGNVHSFIFTDYHYEENFLYEKLNQKDEYGSNGFKGYKILLQKKIPRSELGFQEIDDNRSELYNFGVGWFLKDIDYKDQSANWFVFRRLDDFDESHGPKLFSFLYLNYYGIGTYQTLYYQNFKLPKILCAYPPGACYSVNWKHLYDESGMLKSALNRNEDGYPEYLYSDRVPTWKEYNKEPIFEHGFEGGYKAGLYKLKQEYMKD